MTATTAKTIRKICHQNHQAHEWHENNKSSLTLSGNVSCVNFSLVLSFSRNAFKLRQTFPKVESDYPGNIKSRVGVTGWDAFADIQNLDKPFSAFSRLTKFSRSVLEVTTLETLLKFLVLKPHCPIQCLWYPDDFIFKFKFETRPCRMLSGKMLLHIDNPKWDRTRF